MPFNSGEVQQLRGACKSMPDSVSAQPWRVFRLLSDETWRRCCSFVSGKRATLRSARLGPLFFISSNIEHQPVERLEQEGDALDPLHHLLTRDHDVVPFAEDPLQRIVGHVVVEAAQEQVHRQAHNEFTLRQEARWQRRDNHSTATTTTGKLRAHGLAHDQFGWHVFEFSTSPVHSSPPWWVGRQTSGQRASTGCFRQPAARS